MSSKDNVEEKKVNVKVVIVGDASVGKTCIAETLIRNEFNPNTKATIGTTYLTQTFTYEEYSDVTLKMEIWDTAGSEEYLSLAKIFFKGAGIGVLVYDITKKKTFQHLKEIWVEQLIENSSKNMTIGIAGNKSDLFDSEEVPETEGIEFANKINAVFRLTSAKNNIGVQELFREIGKKYLDMNGVESLVTEQGRVKLESAKGSKNEKGCAC